MQATIKYTVLYKCFDGLKVLHKDRQLYIDNPYSTEFTVKIMYLEDLEHLALQMAW